MTNESVTVRTLRRIGPRANAGIGHAGRVNERRGGVPGKKPLNWYLPRLPGRAAPQAGQIHSQRRRHHYRRISAYVLVEPPEIASDFFRVDEVGRRSAGAVRQAPGSQGHAHSYVAVAGAAGRGLVSRAMAARRSVRLGGESPDTHGSWRHRDYCDGSCRQGIAGPFAWQGARGSY